MLLRHDFIHSLLILIMENTWNVSIYLIVIGHLNGDK
jgi:hypothetical protein